MKAVLKATIDAFTCKLYDVDPDEYKEQLLRECLVFKEALFIIDFTNDEGDYIRTAAISHIGEEGFIKTNQLGECARRVFDSLRKR